MTDATRHRFEQLLVSLPLWENPEGRNALVASILRGHKTWDVLNKGKEAASQLLDLESSHGSEPLLVLLAGLRDEHSAYPGLCRDIDALTTELRKTARQRPSVDWKKDPPYRGLLHFRQSDAPIFFGRDAEVDDLLHTITNTEQGRRFTVVVGDSGSGKSSLVRAGLWARLAETGNWYVAAMKPTDMATPADSLRAALLAACGEHDLEVPPDPLPALIPQLLATSEARWLLILDQMEELFAPGQKAAGDPFLDALLTATQQSNRFQVIATLRADFGHHALRHPPLQRAMFREGGQFPLSQPGRLALEQMVVGPIASLQLPEPWEIDPALPHVIAADAVNNPGGLALMAFALRELYDRNLETRHLDLATYRSPEFGGLSGCIARRADATLKALGAGSEKTLERVFGPLVQVSQYAPPVRRRKPLTFWENDPDGLKLIGAFQRARLLVFGEDQTVEVAHEALLREWPTLKEWIEANRAAFGLAERVRTEAHAWHKSGHHEPHWPPYLVSQTRKDLARAGFLNDVLDDPIVARFLQPLFQWFLPLLKDEHTPPLRRYATGLRLAESGDNRPGVGAIDGIPDILWRLIPAGEVEIRSHGRFPVAAFRIATFPITGAQLSAFLTAEDGYNNQEWWTHLQRQPKDVIWKSFLANHPATNVSWHDATAFCRWLSKQANEEIRLPDEQEWQWAAQSANPAYNYPWGPDWQQGLANTKESGIGSTTAVGVFPGGDSAQAVSDLAGNVWEWCRNRYKNPRDSDLGGDGTRVLRGGAWANLSGDARAAARHYALPRFRLSHLGFRVVCVVPHSLGTDPLAAGH